MRYPVHKIVSYRYGGRQYLSLTRDLGPGGMSLHNSHYIPRGQALDLQIVLGQKSIRLKGRSVYSRLLPNMEVISGIQFTRISEENRRQLDNCLRLLRS